MDNKFRRDKIMNIKKILIILLFSIAIVTIISPVTGKLEGQVGVDSLKEFDGKTKLNLVVRSNIGESSKNFNSMQAISKRKKELNNVNKVIITIEGYKPITFKKPVKDWKLKSKGEYYKLYYFEKSFLVKGKPKDLDFKKSYSMKLYDKKGKLIKTEKWTLMSVY